VHRGRCQWELRNLRFHFQLVASKVHFYLKYFLAAVVCLITAAVTYERSLAVRPWNGPEWQRWLHIERDPVRATWTFRIMAGVFLLAGLSTLYDAFIGNPNR
jgi:hypothetical protein